MTNRFYQAIGTRAFWRIKRKDKKLVSQLISMISKTLRLALIVTGCLMIGIFGAGCGEDSSSKSDSKDKGSMNKDADSMEKSDDSMEKSDDSMEKTDDAMEKDGDSMEKDS